tara:strand:- start:2293 stop:2700 length:408 start_codon:yes stop_codon:yes gene_type:complete
MSLQRLVILDYIVVHSDDVEGGPPGIHPKTPNRGGQLLVRRGVIQSGLLLFMSRGLIEQHFNSEGISHQATDRSGAFLDAFSAPYVKDLRQRADWVNDVFGGRNDESLWSFVSASVADWGSEFEMSSVLWEDAEV